MAQAPAPPRYAPPTAREAANGERGRGGAGPGREGTEGRGRGRGRDSSGKCSDKPQNYFRAELARGVAVSLALLRTHGSADPLPSLSQRHSVRRWPPAVPACTARQLLLRCVFIASVAALPRFSYCTFLDVRDQQHLLREAFAVLQRSNRAATGSCCEGVPILIYAWQSFISDPV